MQFVTFCMQIVCLEEWVFKRYEFQVVNHAKGVIDKAHFTPNGTFPSETKSDLRDAVANVVENTAFYSNLALHFSSIVLDRSLFLPVLC